MVVSVAMAVVVMVAMLVTMSMLMVVRMLVFMMMQPLPRSRAARVFVEHQRFDGHRHRV